MINGLEGIPGSGKSYEAVVYHVLHYVKSGRKVITNLPLNIEAFRAIDPAYADLIEYRERPFKTLGTWDADRTPAFKLFEPGEVDPSPRSATMPDGSVVQLRPPARLFGHVWDYYTTWKNKDGLGPVLIIDECHVSLPKKDTDPQVIEFFKLHRHFNVDILLITQNFRDIDPQISGLLATVIRVRKADILGKSQSAYLRRVFAGFKGAEISSEERKYKPEFFALYKSHTQGNSVQEATGSDVSPFVKKFRSFSLAFYALTAAAVVWAFWPSSDKPKPDPHVKTAASPSVPVSAPSAPSAAPSSQYHFTQLGQPAPPAVDVPVLREEPFKGVEVHITGFMKSATKSYYAFVVSKNGSRIFDLSLKDLEAAGYKFLPLGDCAGVLRFAGKDRAVICDAPAMAAGSNEKPVVIDSASGSRSDKDNKG